tara:strand:- start:192 stop:353 length:162 start_codon:yes stop_codon:yes gene_type:complete
MNKETLIRFAIPSSIFALAISIFAYALIANAVSPSHPTAGETISIDHTNSCAN